MTQKAILITGASSGIGEAMARRLAAEGHVVVAGARRLDRLEVLAKEVAGVEPVRVDVTDRADVEAFAQGPASGTAGWTCWSTTPACCRCPGSTRSWSTSGTGWT